MLLNSNKSFFILMKNTHMPIYNAEIVAGSLLVSESRQIARLLLDNADPAQWHQAIAIENQGNRM
jgi:hypothetical protein